METSNNVMGVMQSVIVVKAVQKEIVSVLSNSIIEGSEK